MPLYEYRCMRCGRLKTDLRAIAHRDDSFVCETCGSEARRIFSGFSTHVKAYSINSAPSPATQESFSGSKNTTILKDCSFENCSGGVSIGKGQKVEMEGTKFKNVKTPIEIRDK
ncbi:zinc ribbon domain-containing protein [Candidatus Nitrospira salsa]